MTLLSAAIRGTMDWPSFVRRLLVPLLLVELAVTAVIVLGARFTNIDWRAYMQEVEGPVVHGTWDYAQLRGETGPLVYPGGFVILYATLRLLAGGDGTDVRMAQWAFAAVYMATLTIVVACYSRARPRGTPPWCVVLFCCASLRLRSIYLLRLFNDCWAMLLFWLAALLFCGERWRWGCFSYSLAVSIKANVLLSAPGLLVLLLQAHGPVGAFWHVVLCAFVQLVLGLPFLLANPLAYIKASLGGFGDLKHKWTVGWKFVPSEVFHAPGFPLALLVVHIILLLFLAARRWTVRQGGLMSLGAVRSDRAAPRLSPEHILVTLLSCNWVGILCARSLHFQFYCWYLHSVPLLLWRCDRLALPPKLLCYSLLEYAWSYGLERVEGTSTPLSSAALQLAHAIILYAVIRADPPQTFLEEKQRCA